MWLPIRILLSTAVPFVVDCVVPFALAVNVLTWSLVNFSFVCTRIVPVDLTVNVLLVLVSSLLITAVYVTLIVSPSSQFCASQSKVSVIVVPLVTLFVVLVFSIVPSFCRSKSTVMFAFMPGSLLV